jgi:hypothetical protein
VNSFVALGRPTFLILAMALQAATANAQLRTAPAARITASIQDRERVAVAARVHPLARSEFDVGSAPGSLPMERVILLLRGSDEQEAALQALLEGLYDSTSPQFHHWLTPDDFGRRFGIADQDIAAITAWLQSHGAVVNSVARNRRMMEFSGTAAQMSALLGSEIHEYRVNGELHYANASLPTIPAALAPVVSGVVSLHNFRRRPMLHVTREAAESRSSAFTISDFNTSTGSHQLTPYDFAAIYNLTPLWNKGIDGTDQSIAIVSRSDYDSYDTFVFQSAFHIPARVTQILNGPDPGTAGDDVLEVTTDVEWSSAVARNAAIKVIVSKSTNSADGIDLSSLYAVDNDVAPIVSVSYGGCEAEGGAFYGELWKQAAAQGISVVVASGDNGSAGCDDPQAGALATQGFAVNALASTPYNVAVGGTTLAEGGQDSTYWSVTNDANHASALSYIPETTWNDSTTTPKISLEAGSGGVSQRYATPSWQTGNGVPSADPGTTASHHRYLPDISFAAGEHDGYMVCLPWNLVGHDCSFVDNTQFPTDHTVVAGTSVSAQVFAGVMALVDQQAGGPQGNPNFHLYPLTTTAGVYHDVTSGNNVVPCSAGVGCSNGTMTGYSAAPGYDLATGLGSTDVDALVTNWGSISFTPTTVSGSLSPTNLVHGTIVTMSASVTASGGTPTGAVAAYVVHNSNTFGLGTADLGSGGNFQPVNSVPGGSSTVYFRYGGDGTFGNSTSTGIPVTVSPEPSLVSATPPATATLGQAFSIPVVVTGQSGVGAPSGNVTLAEGTTSYNSFPLHPDGTLTYFAGSWPSSAGTHSFTMTYGGDESFAPASTSLSITFAKANPPSVNLACNNNNQPVVVNASVTCNVTLFQAFGNEPAGSGTVQFADNGVSAGNPVSLQCGGCIYSTASYTFSNIAAGQHKITASYSGDSFYLPGSSFSPFTFTSSSPTTNVTVYASQPSAAPGSPFFLNAGASPGEYGGPAMTGTVTIFDGTSSIGSASVNTYLQVNLNDSSHPLSIGSHSFLAKYSGDSYWPSATSAAQTVTISNPDFAITGFGSISITRGSSKFIPASVQSIAGLSGTVLLSCSGAPSESTCSLTTTAASIPGGFGVQITTTAPHAQSGTMSSLPFTTVFALLPLGILIGGRRRRNRILLLILLALVVLLISCGGGGGGGSTSSGTPTPTPAPLTDPGTPTGSYTITITATYTSASSSITHSYPIPVTVQ